MEMTIVGYLILGLFAAFGAYTLWAVKNNQSIQAEIKKYDQYLKFALTVVESAEQMYLPEEGEQKLDYALGMFMEYFPEVDERFARAMIEQAVANVNALIDLIVEE